MGVSQPYMYNAEWRSDARFPTTTFDPKAVTRASWEPKPRKPVQNGPLVSFNRHPDAHQLLSHQTSHYIPLGHRSKKWIKWLRNLQLFFRLLELVGASGILALFILITKVEEGTAWTMRVSGGVAMLHCLYGTYHLSRRASGRTPASSASYHVFAGIFDVAIMSIYAFGAFTIHKDSDRWATLLSNQDLLRYFIPAVYYTTVGAGGLHLISLSISLWLGVMFRKITLMPPDMNPLEDHLTARPLHKRNKSSMATMSSFGDEKRFSASTGRGRSDSELNRDSRPPVVPFMHTRTTSSHSGGSRGSYIDLPCRQYQIAPSNSPRYSTHSLAEKRASNPRASQLGHYSSVPSIEPHSSQRDLAGDEVNTRGPTRLTENWMSTDSLLSKKYQRNNATTNASTPRGVPNNKPYTALVQAFDDGDISSDSEYGDENDLAYDRSRTSPATKMHPNPLRSHPTASPQNKQPRETGLPRALGVFKNGQYASLSEMRNNTRVVSNSEDITLQQPQAQSPWKKQRDSSIQLEDEFFSKPYGELKCATPPITVGNERKVSSGIDYGFNQSLGVFGRRNVSGKIVEEGRSFR